MSTREETIAEGLRIADGFKGSEDTFPGFYGWGELYKMHAALVEISQRHADIEKHLAKGRK